MSAFNKNFLKGLLTTNTTTATQQELEKIRQDKLEKLTQQEAQREEARKLRKLEREHDAYSKKQRQWERDEAQQASKQQQQPQHPTSNVSGGEKKVLTIIKPSVNKPEIQLPQPKSQQSKKGPQQSLTKKEKKELANQQNDVVQPNESKKNKNKKSKKKREANEPQEPLTKPDASLQTDVLETASKKRRNRKNQKKNAASVLSETSGNNSSGERPQLNKTFLTSVINNSIGKSASKLQTVTDPPGQILPDETTICTTDDYDEKQNIKKAKIEGNEASPGDQQLVQLSAMETPSGDAPAQV